MYNTALKKPDFVLFPLTRVLLSFSFIHRICNVATIKEVSSFVQGSEDQRKNWGRGLEGGKMLVTSEG